MQGCKKSLVLEVRKAIAPPRKYNRLQNVICPSTPIIAQSTPSNLSLQVGDYQEEILIPATDANAEVMEIPCTGSEKKRLQPKSNAIASTTKFMTIQIMAQNMITTFSLQEAQLDEPTEKILLPPSDPNAEIIEIPGYILVYVNGACPRTYRVYTDDSMIGVIFQHITHWSNAVDKIRYAEPVDAAVGLDNFMKVARVSTTATEQSPTEEDLFDKEFDALTSDEWERLKRYVPETRDLVAA
ncbi:hypothetical protein A4S05_21715 [Nostoc sp. KVJ20]|uniref:hypothetical protein n=1 Tax=Nostoc sp. KVJ20 TaxID=457944 RepID=UPI00083E124A|nr:hypothetical protein [Nostoc sp. KVJ20]ODH02957.1 hypothetical protein A4S05_21715 [Nostoc sp. KVJ20]